MGLTLMAATDSLALTQGAPVIVARGPMPTSEGLDYRGQSPSAQSLALIRAAVRHGSVQHPCCWSPVNDTSPPGERVDPGGDGGDLQSQLKPPTPIDAGNLTREALRRRIAVEAARWMPEGAELARVYLEGL